MLIEKTFPGRKALTAEPDSLVILICDRESKAIVCVCEFVCYRKGEGMCGREKETNK